MKESETVVTLLSEPERRLAAAQQGEEVPATEYTNLYPIQLRRKGSGAVEHQVFRDKRREFLSSLQDALVAKNWFVDSIRHGLLTAHRRGDYHGRAAAVDECVRLFGAYSFNLRDYHERTYLCIDFTLQVKNALKLSTLLQLLPASALIERSAIARINGWQRGRITALDDEWATIRLFDFDQVERVAVSNVIPDLPPRQIAIVLKARGLTFDLSREIKQRSLSATPAASRMRSERTQALVEDVARSVFPIKFAGMDVILTTKPLGLARDTRDAKRLAGALHPRAKRRVWAPQGDA